MARACLMARVISSLETFSSFTRWISLSSAMASSGLRLGWTSW
jgi:hypothetical protein